MITSVASQPPFQPILPIPVSTPKLPEVDPVDSFDPRLPAGEVVVSTRPPQLSHPADKFYSEQPLGAMWQPEATTFRVFAPTADQVQLRLYQAPQGGEAQLLPLERHPDGTWAAVVEGDLRGKFYTYSAAGRDPGFRPSVEVCDPYSKCVTGPEGRSLIVVDEQPVADRPQFPLDETIIYEMHLRDYTIDPDSGVQRRGKYLGLTEGGTHLTGRPEIATGLDHLSELGVNTVQIMPINEFNLDDRADAYGWGYDATLYQTPDGWYTSQTLDSSRVSETKQMVNALHQRGIRVVLDTVLNHTDEGWRKRAGAFEGLVPGYYYRRRPDGSYFDGAACGNELRSEAPMMRRFIKDTLKTWVNDYKIDGFRFDLMGLMDKQTAKEMAQELLAIDPKLVLYGEPWAAGETPNDILIKGDQKNQGFGVFNDTFRDALKGSVFYPQDQGFIQNGGRSDLVRRGIEGSIHQFTAAPPESINYVECHDNHTLWDRLVLSTQSDSSISDEERKDMDRLAAAVLLTSQGIPFLHSGQEMLRTKGGDGNSYDKPDSINMLRWQQKWVHRDVVDYYQGLIGLRKTHPMFHLKTAEQVRQGLKFQDRLPGKMVGYTLTDPTGQDSWKRAQVYFNAGSQSQKVSLPVGEWQVFVDGHKASNTPLLNTQVQQEAEQITIPPRSAVVLGELR